ncbi:MAG: GAF domain-containing protein, partial [Chloroflexi bacterium]|nr:GAF domain-containing protein [Chloroflexota bacterium]
MDLTGRTAPHLPEPDQALYQRLVDNALAATGTRLVYLSQFDEARQATRLVAIAGLDGALAQRGLAAIRRFAPAFDPFQVWSSVRANPLLQALYETGQPVAAPFVEVAAGTVDQRIIQIGVAVAGLRVSYVCPLLVAGRFAGTLTYDTREELAGRDRHVCDAFARQAALTLELSRWADAEARRAHQAEQIAHVLSAVGAASDVEAALETLLCGAVALLGGTQGIVRLLDPETGERVLSLHLEADGTIGRFATRTPLCPGSIGASLAAGGPSALIEDHWTHDAAAQPPHAHMREHIRCSLNVPIEADGRRVGSLHVNHDEPGFFRAADLALAEALASRAGGVIERARVQEAQERERAERAKLEGALLVARTVAHDVNNALAPVSGFAELLGLHPLVRGDVQLESYARLIFDGAAQVAEKVQRLQGIIRLELKPPEQGLGPDKPVLDLER